MKRPREASGPGYRPAEEPVEGAVFWQLVSGRPDSTEVAVGRTTLVDTVPMGYRRPRGDATTCPMDESMTYRPTVIEPGNAGRGGGRPVISGAPSWGSSSNAVATVALPSGKNSEEFKMAVDPEMGKADKGARHKERAMSVDQWNPTKRLI